MVARLLARGHLRTRWRRYALLGASFGTGLLAFLIVASVTESAREALLRPLSDTLIGDVRVTQGTEDLAGGRTWMDVRELEARLERETGARVVARLETNYITVQGDRFENWSAGLLLGIDIHAPEERERIQDHLVWGEPLDSLDAFGPDGRAYVPLVIGKPAAKRLNLTLDENGTFDQPLTLTSGRLALGGDVLLPLTLDCVVVGVFDTGIEPLDKFTAYMPIEHARVLTGAAEGDPVANALLVHGAEVEEVRRALPDGTYRAQSDDAFAFGYLGSTLVVLYAAGATALALFLTVLGVWLVHDTATLLRADQGVVSTLRALGVPSARIRLAYSALAAGSVAAGTVAAWLVAAALRLCAPPLPWRLSGLRADLPWNFDPWRTLLAGAVLIVLAFAATWWTARRIERLNILDGLRSS